MIDAKKARMVAEAFDQAAKTVNGSVDMLETVIIRSEKCGTVACHAGWYALMTIKEQEWHFSEYLGCEYLKTSNPGCMGMGFTYGKIKMALDLGFPCADRLEDWAQANPEIWGNAFGNRMFGSTEAFGKDERCNVTLAEIADHWHRVSDRLEKSEMRIEK